MLLIPFDPFGRFVHGFDEIKFNSTATNDGEVEYFVLVLVQVIQVFIRKGTCTYYY